MAEKRKKETPVTFRVDALSLVIASAHWSKKSGGADPFDIFLLGPAKGPEPRQLLDSGP